MTLPANQIDVWKQASQEDKIKALVLLGALPAREAGDQMIDKAAYYISLDGVTRHGLAEAVKFILRGALGHAFFPSPPELRMQCDKAMEWPELERERIRRREQMERERPPVRRDPSPESKARVAALAASLHDISKQVAEDMERSEIRARYGMTPEVLDAMKDQPVPSNFKQPTVRVKCS